MGLRDIAAADNRAILGDTVTGPAHPITLKDPAGLSVSIDGYSNDIGLFIDPDTGTAVSGRTGTVAFNIAELLSKGFTSLPEGISDASSKPWIAIFNDVNGNPHTFKITRTHPDRSLGMITCVIEVYVDAS